MLVACVAVRLVLTFTMVQPFVERGGGGDVHLLSHQWRFLCGCCYFYKIILPFLSIMSPVVILGSSFYDASGEQIG